MKKMKKIVIGFIIAAILGLLLSFLKHNGHYQRLIEGLKSIRFYIYPILIIVSIFVTILVHELGHLISFVYHKIKIKALFVLMVILKKNKQNKWKIGFEFENLKMFGGLVVPDIAVIDSDVKYNELRTKFAKALILGPIMSYVYFGVITILWLLVWFLTSNNILTAILFINFTIVLLLTILITITSKFHTNEIYGDFVAYDKFKKDDIFALAQICQYIAFSNNDQTDSDKFLREKISKHYENANPRYNIFDYSIISFYFSSYLKYNLEEENISVKLLNYYNVNSLLSSENGFELPYLFSAYYYSKGDVFKAYALFNNAVNSSNKYIADDKKILLKHTYEHLMNLKNHEEYFHENKQSILADYSILKPIIDIDEVVSEYVIALPFQVYECKLENIEENND